ncbi:MAG: hypothetical protein COA49_00180 [Bacteroidetes bacterium]|nr:MAG: hypothetical protein COA49_00180 [Bacteroidota bacterium]
MISCEEAATICSKTQYKEASFIEKMRLSFHIFICKTCSKFSKNNKHLSSLCEKAKLHTLTEAEKVEMKENIKSEI